MNAAGVVCGVGAVLLMGCQNGRYVIPDASIVSGKWDGTGYYKAETTSDADPFVKVRNRLIPYSLLTDSRTFAAARNCAQAHNEAIELIRQCTVGSTFLRVGAISAGLLGALSAGIAGSMRAGEEGAQRSWQWSALTSSLVAASFGAIELFTNCSERRESQAMTSIRRAGALANAAHLVACSQKQRESLSAQKLLAGVKAVASAETTKAIDASKATPIETLVQIKASTTDPVAAKAATEALNRVSMQTPVLTCTDNRTADERTQRPTEDFFMDEAHRALTECLNSEYVGLGPSSGSK